MRAPDSLITALPGQRHVYLHLPMKLASALSVTVTGRFRSASGCLAGGGSAYCPVVASRRHAGRRAARRISAIRVLSNTGSWTTTRSSGQTNRRRELAAKDLKIGRAHV